MSTASQQHAYQLTLAQGPRGGRLPPRGRYKKGHPAEGAPYINLLFEKDGVRLPSNAFRLYTLLAAEVSNHTGVCRFSITGLSSKLELSCRTTRRVLQELKEAGGLTKLTETKSQQGVSV